MTSTATKRTPRSEWVPEAYELHNEGNGDGTGGWSLSRIAAMRGCTKAAVSKAFTETYGDDYTDKPRTGWLPWEVPRRHWDSTTARRCVLLARRAAGVKLTEEEETRLDLFLARISSGMVMTFDPRVNQGRGAFVQRLPVPGEKILYGLLAVDPGGFDDEDDC